jgi:hypothetical protein
MQLPDPKGSPRVDSGCPQFLLQVEIRRLKCSDVAFDENRIVDAKQLLFVLQPCGTRILTAKEARGHSLHLTMWEPRTADLSA